MSLDITPAIVTGGQLIQRYGDGGFRVAGIDYQGSIIVRVDATDRWPVSAVSEIDLTSLTPLSGVSPAVDILLIGCGPRFSPPPSDLRRGLKNAGMVLEWMDTGAACRTFNVLLAEGRAVAAALIANP